MGTLGFARLSQSVRNGSLDEHSYPVVGGLLMALLNFTSIFLVLAVATGHALPALVILGPMFPLVLLGILTVKHMELGPRRSLVRSPS
jgi:hypothetical protein